ncbi:MAG TPA: HD domain-containing protein, partial [Acidimicrobiales bacterium]|nr:HD domain-containing protein [Acidimicrobiales bacterium]
MVTVERQAAPFRRPGLLDDLLGGVLGRFDSRRADAPAEERSLIERAGRLAETAHRDQLRQSGEPYITHPVAVAAIVADLGLDARSVAAALLHDAVEDTGLGLA